MDRLDPRAEKARPGTGSGVRLGQGTVRGPVEANPENGSGTERPAQTRPAPTGKGTQNYLVWFSGKEIAAQGSHGLRPGDPVVVLKHADGSFSIRPQKPPVESGVRRPENVAAGNDHSGVLSSNRNSAPAFFSPGDTARQALLAARMPLSAAVVAQIAADSAVVAARLGSPDRRDLTRIAAFFRELEKKGLRVDPLKNSDSILKLAGLFAPRIPGDHDGEQHSTPESGALPARPQRGDSSQSGELPESMLLDLFNTFGDNEGLWRIYAPSPDCFVRVFFKPGSHGQDSGDLGLSAADPDSTAYFSALPGLVNVDIDGSDGTWSFHWNESERGILRVLPPPRLNDEDDEFAVTQAVGLIPGFVAGLGFDRIVAIGKESWYDGFYFSDALSIIKSVDLLG